MTADMSAAERMLSETRATLEAAAVDALRAEHVAEILAQPGLAYGSTGDGSQDQYVSYEGEHIGDVRHEAPGTSPLLGWYAYPIDGEKFGPFPMARQGAAELMRRHVAGLPAAGA